MPKVIVTAKRVEENLQNVSISATAIDAIELRNRTVNTSWEALALVPNLSYDYYITSQVHFSIRGFTSNAEITGIESGIAMNVDDVYIPRVMDSVLFC
jgi:iron complex outermembrane receptor protein